LDAVNIITDKNFVYHKSKNLPSNYQPYLFEWPVTWEFDYMPWAILVLTGGINQLRTTSWKVNFIKALQLAYSGTTLSGSQDFTTLFKTLLFLTFSYYRLV